MRRLLSFVLTAVLMILVGVVSAAAQQPDFNAMIKRFREFYAAGNYADALTEGQKYEAGVKAQFGTNHATYGSALYNLALVYQAQGNYAQAEGLLQRALAVYEKALGAGHPSVANTLNILAAVYRT
jgi:tetratricopeptide (TPR) repeat protein